MSAAYASPPQQQPSALDCHRSKSPERATGCRPSPSAHAYFDPALRDDTASPSPSRAAHEKAGRQTTLTAPGAGFWTAEVAPSWHAARARAHISTRRAPRTTERAPRPRCGKETRGTDRWKEARPTRESAGGCASTAAPHAGRAAGRGARSSLAGPAPRRTLFPGPPEAVV